MNRFIEFVVLLAMTPIVLAGPPQAPTPPQAPPVQEETQCIDCDVKVCSPCSNACTCGCNEGLPCECCSLKPVIIHHEPDVKLWREPVMVRSSIRASSPAIVTRPAIIQQRPTAAYFAAPQAWAVRPTLYAAPLRGSNAQSCGPRG